MKLYELLSLMEDGSELTVWDQDYDIEVYFYAEHNPTDEWDKALMELSKLLTVTKFGNNGVTVNLSEVIENHLEELEKANLFRVCDIDEIMDDAMSIFSGYVSEEWLEKFVKILKM